MGLLQKQENRNAAQARNSFVTRKAEQKLSALADTFKAVAKDTCVDEERGTLTRTLHLDGYQYLSNLKFIYNWENRFLSVNYNLQILSFIDVNERFREVGPCKFEVEFSRKRHSNDRFVCKSWRGEDKTPVKGYLERLNNPLIIDRIHDLDIHGVTVTHKPEWKCFRISVESMIGSGAWIFIPPIMQLIMPKDAECVKFMELFELLGDALVNNSVEEDNVETD